MKTKTVLTSIALAAVALVSCAPKQIKSDICPSAYPLVTIDPYTSAWSMTDNLYDSNVKHWTGRDFPLVGVLTVDGQQFRFMGDKTTSYNLVLPSADCEFWPAKYVFSKPSGDWTAPEYRDDSWLEGKGAFRNTERLVDASAETAWDGDRIWVRRYFDLPQSLEGGDVFMEYTNDDDAVFYINGIKIFETGACHHSAVFKLPAEAVATLKQGRNLIAAECINRMGGAELDMGLFTKTVCPEAVSTTAVQKSAEVQAMQTIYTFACGGMDLELTFTAPLFMDDLDLLSRPVNYITYKLASNDGKKHQTSISFEASPDWALDQPYQAYQTFAESDDSFAYLRAGSKNQRILGKKGDDRRIDWGYFYLAAAKNGTEVSAEGGRMTMDRDLGLISKASDYVMVGYDDIYSIQYFKENLRPYWNRTGDKTIQGQFAAAAADYQSLMKRACAFDYKLLSDATKAGGKKYAELCALAYRQAIAAHKLVEAPNGDLLWLSKENNSNGSIGTVDVTYPSAPLFLIYNTDLAKGLLNHIYYYAESGKWAKPFPAHDVGTYPWANGQTYGADMPVEEGGNVITLTAAICHYDNDYAYASKHWDILTTWVEYLMQFGLDPENQLCTDDFAGHFAHNTNLSIKAIVAIASYARMAEKLGQQESADKYYAAAREMAAKWMEMADDGDHYRLTFDKEGTWSQKYNLVWDKLLGLNIFPAEVAAKEIAYYKTVQNEYGLPLDNRKTYTKTDWIVWTATLAEDRESFEALIDPVYKFQCETDDRVPMSDWVWTDKAVHVGFKARSVVGGYFIKMLDR